MSKKQRGTLQKWNRIEKKNDSSFYETCKPRAICRFDAADQKGGDRKSFKRDSRLTAVREGRGETQSGPNYLLTYILYLLLTDFSTVWSFTRFPLFLHLWHIHLETVIFRTMLDKIWVNYWIYWSVVYRCFKYCYVPCTHRIPCQRLALSFL